MSYDKSWTWLVKRNFQRESESLRITVENHTTNYVKAKINKTQPNTKCRLSGD